MRVRNELNVVNQPNCTVLPQTPQCTYNIVPLDTEYLFPGAGDWWKNVYTYRYFGDAVDTMIWKKAGTIPRNDPYKHHMLNGTLPHTGEHHYEIIVNDGCVTVNVPCYYTANTAPILDPNTTDLEGKIYRKFSYDLSTHVTDFDYDPEPDPTLKNPLCKDVIITTRDQYDPLWPDWLDLYPDRMLLEGWPNETFNGVLLIKYIDSFEKEVTLTINLEIIDQVAPIVK